MGSYIKHTNSIGRKREQKSNNLQVKINPFTGTVYGYESWYFSGCKRYVSFGSDFGNKHTIVCSIQYVVVS